MDPAPHTPAPKSSLAVRIAGTVTFILVLGFAALWFAAALLMRGERAAWFALAIFLICLLGAGLAWWRKLKFLETWRSVALVWVVFAPLLVWLSWDEKEITHRVTLEDLSPAPALADVSHALTLVYTKQPGADKAARTMTSTKFYLKNSPVDKLAKWREEILANREKVAAEWAALAPERAWLEELNRFDAIGDTTTLNFETPMMNFSVARHVTEVACAQAGLLALDGQGEAAFALLDPLIAVLMKLERHGRTEFRILASQRSAETAWAAMRFVLETAPVSTHARKLFSATLANRDPGSIARRLAWLPYLLVVDNIIAQPKMGLAIVAQELGIKGSFWVSAFSTVAPFAFLQNATANQLARVSATMEKAIREPDSTESRAAFQDLMRQTVQLPVKNFGGRGLCNLAMPNYQKMGERLQQSEKARRALLEALNGLGG
jgi:hypothetical protein